MTITVTELLQGASSTDSQATYTTASITPATNGNVVLIAWATSRPSSTAPSISSSSGMGLTWTNLNTGANIAGASVCLRTGLIQGIGTASNGAVTFTMATSTATGIAWCVFQLAGALNTGVYTTSNHIESSVTTAQTSTSLTLPITPVAGNMVLGIVAHAVAGEVITPGANFTKGTRAGYGTPNVSLDFEYKTVLSTTVNATWATSSVYSAMGQEITAAGGGGATADFVDEIPI